MTLSQFLDKVIAIIELLKVKFQLDENNLELGVFISLLYLI